MIRIVLCTLPLLACRYQFDDVHDGGTSTDRPPSACAFAGGLHAGTELRGDGRVALAGAALTGTYTLPVCDWTGARELTLVPAAPYGKPLGRTTETEYTAGNLDTSALVGLWHLDGALGPVATGAPIPEAGSTSPGTARNANAQGMARTPGIFGEALACDGIDDHVEVAPSVIWRGFDALTIQVWANADYSGPAPAFMRLVSYWETGDTLGSTFQVSHFPSGDIALMLTDAGGSEPGVGVTWGQTAGTWHHLVGVYDGSNAAMYIDGVDMLDRAPVTGTLQDRMGALYFCQGGSSNPPPIYAYDGRIDEVALWKRALSAAEISDLYTRGATGLRAQVRACDEPSCEGEPFVGPDGTAATYFSEASSTVASISVHDLVNVPDAPYLQVAVTLSRASATLDPQVVDVIVAR